MGRAHGSGCGCHAAGRKSAQRCSERDYSGERPIGSAGSCGLHGVLHQDLHVCRTTRPLMTAGSDFYFSFGCSPTAVIVAALYDGAVSSVCTLAGERPKAHRLRASIVTNDNRHTCIRRGSLRSKRQHPAIAAIKKTSRPVLTFTFRLRRSSFFPALTQIPFAFCRLPRCAFRSPVPSTACAPAAQPVARARTYQRLTPASRPERSRFSPPGARSNAAPSIAGAASSGSGPISSARCSLICRSNWSTRHEKDKNLLPHRTRRRPS